MCLGAIYWLRFRTLYYANTRAEPAAIGFDDEFTCCEMLLAAAARAIPGVHLRTPQFRLPFATAAREKRVQLRRNRSCMPSAWWRTIEHAMTPAWPMIELFPAEHGAAVLVTLAESAGSSLARSAPAWCRARLPSPPTCLATSTVIQVLTVSSRPRPKAPSWPS